MLGKPKEVVHAEGGACRHLLGKAAKSRRICQIAQKNTIDFWEPGEMDENKVHQKHFQTVVPSGFSETLFNLSNT